MKNILIIDRLLLRSQSIELLINKSMPLYRIQSIQDEQNFESGIQSFTGDVLIVCATTADAKTKELLQYISAAEHWRKTILITNYVSHWVIGNLKSLRMSGYLVMKSNDEKTITTAIANISSGLPFYCMQVCKAICNQECNYSQVSLSNREREIIQLISQDMITKEIASELCLSEFTISSYRKNLLKKLKLRTTGGLIAFAKDRHLI